MNYATIKWPDVANGPGTRISLFVSGCDFACKGCFNESAWDFHAGREYTPETEAHILERLKDRNCNGLTILGGEPLHPKNITNVASLIAQAKYTCPEKPIWIYSGYTLTELMKRTATGDTYVQQILQQADVLVDGRFNVRLKDPILLFRGSSNQKLIDLNQTRKTNFVQIIEVNLEKL